MHFPLLKKTEVLVAFTEGDPDRPIILSALPNPDTPSVITKGNPQQSIMRTPSGAGFTITNVQP